VACAVADVLFTVDVGGVVWYKAHFQLLILGHWLEMEAFIQQILRCEHQMTVVNHSLISLLDVKLSNWRKI
jgi:hypothetical protein